MATIESRLIEAAKVLDMDYLHFLAVVDKLSRISPTIPKNEKTRMLESLRIKLGAEGTEELINDYRIAGSKKRP